MASEHNKNETFRTRLINCVVLRMFLLLTTAVSLTTGENFPYAISVLLEGKQLCAGILIDLEYTLTTCHCVGIFYLGKFIARDPNSMELAGGHSVIGLVNKKYSSVQTRQIDEIIIHPKCSDIPWAWTFDYSLLKAKLIFRLNLTLRPMDLPFSNPDTLGRVLDISIQSSENCHAIGWENNFEIDRLSRILPGTRLKSTSVRLIYWEDCLKKLCSSGPNNICEKFNPEDRTKVCAIDSGLSESCDLSDGGPVVCHGYAVGLLSKGLQCGSYIKPRTVVKLNFALEFVGELI